MKKHSLILFLAAALAAGSFTMASAEEQTAESPVVVNSPEEASWWTPVTSIDFSPKKDVLIENSDGSLSPMDEAHFEVKQINDNTWQILSDGDYCYLAAGNDYAVCIDSGYGAGNLRAFCQTLTDKPVKYVLNTHYHFDHTANDAYFDAAYMSKETVPLATIPYASFAGIHFPRNYPVVIVKDGDTIDLGGRVLEVFEIPNHTQGGIVFLDRKNRILFAGDEFIKPKAVTLNCSVEKYAENMKKMSAVASDISTMLCGAGIITDSSCIDRFLLCADYILQGGEPDSPSEKGSSSYKAPQPVSVPGKTVYLRHRVRPGDGGAGQTAGKEMVTTTFGGVSITYDKNKIHKEKR